ncbi:YHS domain-containing protein [Blastomonas sp. CCH7-E1]|uniref:YHS domain-containing protein n=1 Tax=Blastomonas sp. CCH7-E1 TaxID=1768745 RepID=UPI0009EC1A4C|nr:YHS domain-containing protein [Blastomonas sp. CCH7-E1]
MPASSNRTDVVATDPVCGMTVEPAGNTPSAVHQGEAFYFCSSGCHVKFVAEPGRFVSGSRRPTQDAAVTSVNEV